MCKFNFIRNHQSVAQSDYTILHSYSPIILVFSIIIFYVTMLNLFVFLFYWGVRTRNFRYRRTNNWGRYVRMFDIGSALEKWEDGIIICGSPGIFPLANMSCWEKFPWFKACCIWHSCLKKCILLQRNTLPLSILAF